MKKHKAITVIVSLVLLSVIFTFAVSKGLSSVNSDYAIFSDISECESITELHYPNSEFVLHSDISVDDGIKNLSAAESFCASYSSSRFDFDIYAHEFYTYSDAKIYFSNVSGRESTKDTEYFAYGGMTSYYHVVIDGKNAYTVKCSSSDSDDVKELLLSLFDKTI